VPIFKAAQNVNVIGKADFAYPKGSSTISATLHGAAILLRLPKKWDWFVNLGAADYPLVTPDGKRFKLFWWHLCFLFSNILVLFLDYMMWVFVGFEIKVLVFVFVGFVDLLHILSYLPKDLNFVNHSSYIGWREYVKLTFKTYWLFLVSC